MLAHSIFFYFFSVIAIFSSLMVITSRNTVNSVFFLILDFISVGCLFIMVGAEFLGMIILIVYVGAVAVLFLFVVMMLNVAEQKQSWFIGKNSTHIPVGLIVSLLIYQSNLSAAPPFNDLVWINEEIITSKDPTTFQKLIYEGEQKVKMWANISKKVGGRNVVEKNLNAYVFTAYYEDNSPIIIQATPKFESKENASRILEED